MSQIERQNQYHKGTSAVRVHAHLTGAEHTRARRCYAGEEEKEGWRGTKRRKRGTGKIRGEERKEINAAVAVGSPGLAPLVLAFDADVGGEGGWAFVDDRFRGS